MVSKNRDGLGKLSKVPFSWANARPAEIAFLKMFFVSMSSLGGSNGKSLYGIFRLNFSAIFKRKFYPHCYYEGKNTKESLLLLL